MRIEAPGSFAITWSAGVLLGLRVITDFDGYVQVQRPLNPKRLIEHRLRGQ